MPPPRKRRPLPPILVTLKEDRLERGLTLTKVASDIGMSTMGVRAYEEGLARPSLDALIAWGQVMGYELTWTRAASPVERDYLLGRPHERGE